MTPSPRGALAMWWSVLAAVLVAWNPQRCVGQQPGDPADDTWRLKPPKPLLMPESHLGTTPWAERHVTVTMYSSKNLILYEIDNSGSWTQYTEEVVIDEPGTHIVTAVSSDSGILSENATAVYKVAAVAKGYAYDGYLDHCEVGLDLDGDLAIDGQSVKTSLDSFGRAVYKLGTLKGLRSGYAMLQPDHPSGCVCGVPKPNCCCDKSVGIPQMLYLRTPSNATQLNPVTTILSQILDQDPGMTAGDAQDTLKRAWDLPDKYDVERDDILWLSLNAYLDVDKIGPRSIVRMAQAEVAACCVAMAIAGASGEDWPNVTVATSVYSAMATMAVEAAAPGAAAVDFAAAETAETLASMAAKKAGASLSPAASNATAASVAELSTRLVALLSRHGSEAASSGFSLPVEIAAVSRDANTAVGNDLNLVAAGAMTRADFGRKHLEGEKEEAEAPVPAVVEVPAADSSAEEGGVELNEPPLPAKPAGGAGLGAWQWVLVGGVGAPAVFLVGLYAARRRHKADKDQLLNLVERHNLLGGGRDPEDGLGPGGASRSHGHDTQAVASSIGLKPKPGGAKNKGKQKASARVVEAAEETKTCTGPLDVDLALGDAFGSPQRIRHRPPKSSGLKRGQRQTLMFDHSRQTWHMPIEVPGPPDNHSNLSTPEESPRTPGKGTAPAMLGAIEEDAAEAQSRPQSASRNPLHDPAAERPEPPAKPSPPPSQPNVFVRRTKLYKPK